MLARVANNESDNKAGSIEVCKRTTMSLEMRKDDKRESYVKLAKAGNALDLNLIVCGESTIACCLVDKH